MNRKANKVGQIQEQLIAHSCDATFKNLYISERVSDGLDKASRKRSLDAPGNKGSAEKRIMLMDDKDDILEEESENLFQDSLKQPHAGNRQVNGRRPLQLSNLGSLEQHHLGVLGFGKWCLGPSDMYEDSGDFVVDPESEIFSIDRQTQDLAGDGQVESKLILHSKGHKLGIFVQHFFSVGREVIENCYLEDFK